MTSTTSTRRHASDKFLDRLQHALAVAFADFQARGLQVTAAQLHGFREGFDLDAA